MKKIFKQRFFGAGIISLFFFAGGFWGVFHFEGQKKNTTPLEGVFQYYDTEDGVHGQEKRAVFSYVNPEGKTMVYRSANLNIRDTHGAGGSGVTFTQNAEFKVGDKEILYYQDDDHIYTKIDSLRVPAFFLILGVCFLFGAIKSYRQDKKR